MKSACICICILNWIWLVKAMHDVWNKKSSIWRTCFAYIMGMGSIHVVPIVLVHHFIQFAVSLYHMHMVVEVVYYIHFCSIC